MPGKLHNNFHNIFLKLQLITLIEQGKLTFRFGRVKTNFEIFFHGEKKKLEEGGYEF